MSENITLYKRYANFAHHVLPLYACNDQQRIYDLLDNGDGSTYLNSLWVTTQENHRITPINLDFNLTHQQLGANWETFLIEVQNPYFQPKVIFISMAFNFHRFLVKQQVISMRYFLFELEESPKGGPELYAINEWRGRSESIFQGNLSITPKVAFLRAIQQHVI